MSYLPHQLRVIAEKAELLTRIFALDAFVNSEKFSIADPDERERLQHQLALMTEYAEVLHDRIAAFPVNDTPVPAASPTNVTELNPELAGQALFKEAVPIGAAVITDVDTFAMHVDHWHAKKMEQGNRLLTIPVDTTIQLEDAAKPGEIIEMNLDGAYHEVFKVGVMTTLNLFKDLPFGASIEDTSADEQPAT